MRQYAGRVAVQIAAVLGTEVIVAQLQHNALRCYSCMKQHAVVLAAVGTSSHVCVTCIAGGSVCKLVRWLTLCVSFGAICHIAGAETAGEGYTASTESTRTSIQRTDSQLMTLQ
jgi:hypothetical protein